jgi:hypothetical protein
VFVGVENIAAVAVDEVGDSCDFALLVGAGDQQDGGRFHAVIWCGHPYPRVFGGASKRQEYRFRTT